MQIAQALNLVCNPAPKRCEYGSLKGNYKGVSFVVWPVERGVNFQLHLTAGPDHEREELKQIVLRAWRTDA